MKNLLIVLLAVFSLSIQAQEAKRYAIESGYIKYELSGNTKGSKELWWDDYGTKTCELEKSTTTTKIFGIKNTEEKNSCTVIVKDKFWAADYIKNSGSNGTIPYYNEGQKMVNEMSEKEQQEFADEVLTQMGGQKVGTESLSGYECDIIKIMGIKSWIYKGLVLKVEGKIMGIEANEKFVEFKPKSSVPASKFNPPSGVEYENLAEQAGAQGLMGAFGGLGNFEEEEKEDNTTPVDYSYDKFKKIVNACEVEGYTCSAINSIEGMHAATFTKGMANVMVMAQSDKNMEDDDEFNSFDSFRKNGHTCHYGELNEENGSALVVEYPSDDMIVTFLAMPKKSKEELLKFESKMQF